MLSALALAGCAVTGGSEAELNAYGHAVAREYKAWVGTPNYTAWLATQPQTGPIRFGFTMECSAFSKLNIPAKVKSCIQGPGPADGPTITLQLTDGRTLMFDAWGE